MATTIALTAADGHALDAWRADPVAAAKGGIVIVQAIYGRTAHLGEVCDRFAADGYAAIAPALYDRSGKNLVFSYDDEGRRAGMAQRDTLAEPAVLADVAACADALRPAGPVAVLGFCTGGTWAWVAAARLELDAAVIFYGSNVYERRDLRPRCPVILHYGDRDHAVPMAQVEEIRAAHPALPLHLYPGAGHAFFNPEQASYYAEAASAAYARTLAFLETHLHPSMGGTG